ncbi:hypothetical protein ABBQ32_003974 [Trebouxia sp. C0010 RCD-2024]
MGVLTSGASSLSKQAYNNKVLEGNWFEDRYLESEGTDVDPVMRPFEGPEEPLVGATQGRLSYLAHVVTAPHHDRQAKPNTRRCIPVHYPPGSVYKPITQKQADSAHIHERLAAHRTPMMLTAANVSLATPFGSTPLVCSKTTWGLGNTALSQSDYEAHEGRWETTNRHFYVDLPAEKRMVKPEYYNTAVDTSHHIHAALANEAADDARTASVQGGPCGRAGARGAMSRNAAEPGSLYGSSVFWDEYAAGKVGPWGQPGGVYGPTY